LRVEARAARHTLGTQTKRENVFDRPRAAGQVYRTDLFLPDTAAGTIRVTNSFCSSKPTIF
jgi:hypothetical protein